MEKVLGLSEKAGGTHCPAHETRVLFKGSTGGDVAMRLELSTCDWSVSIPLTTSCFGSIRPWMLITQVIEKTNKTSKRRIAKRDAERSGLYPGHVGTSLGRK